MGCAQSKIDNEESVSRCKERRNYMKDAVIARNAFASGHSGYAIALKNTGAALSDYAQGEGQEQDHLVQLGPVDPPSLVSKPPPPPMMDHGLPPPPPPLPNFSPATPLQRSVTMPVVFSKEIRKMGSVEIVEEVEGEEEGGGLELRKKRRNGVVGKEETPPRTPVAPPPPDSKGMAWDYFFMVDNMHGQMEGVREEEEEEVEGEDDGFDERYSEHENGNHNNDHAKNRDNDMVGGKFSEASEPRTPEKVVMEGFTTEEEETPVPVGLKEKQFMHSNTAPPDMRRMPVNYSKGGMGHSGVNLLKILGDIDDHFLKASECAQEVSKMLEATRLHYHSNFADNRGD